MLYKNIVSCIVLGMISLFGATFAQAQTPATTLITGEDSAGAGVHSLGETTVSEAKERAEESALMSAEEQCKARKGVRLTGTFSSQSLTASYCIPVQELPGYKPGRRNRTSDMCYATVAIVCEFPTHAALESKTENAK